MRAIRRLLIPKGIRALLAGALLLVGAVDGARCADEPPAPGTLALLPVGATMPPMALLDAQGVSQDISRSSGGPLALYFWSVFCPNCKEAFPALSEFHERWKGRGLKLWAVNVDGDRFSNAVRGFLDEAGLPFPVVFDRLEGEMLVAADPLGVSKTPTLYLADAQGRVLARQAIQLDFEAAEKALAGAYPASQ